jgi:hypothetical protein
MIWPPQSVDLDQPRSVNIFTREEARDLVGVFRAARFERFHREEETNITRRVARVVIREVRHVRGRHSIDSHISRHRSLTRRGIVKTAPPAAEVRARCRNLSVGRSTCVALVRLRRRRKVRSDSQQRETEQHGGWQCGVDYHKTVVFYFFPGNPT